MKRQKGSILVGVLALSVAMSVAAGGFILLSANTAKDGDAILDERALHYAAQSGLYMGVRWIRAYKKSEISVAWNDSLLLTSGVDGFMDMDGIKVKVKFVDDDDAGAGGNWSLYSLATAGTGRDTLKIVWQVNSLDDTFVPGMECNVNLQDWVETLAPGKP